MAAESKLEKQMRKYAESLDMKFYKWVSPGIRGVPDRILLGRYGLLSFIEMKSPGKSLRPEQVMVVSEIRSRGFEVYVIDAWEKGKYVIDEMARTQRILDRECTVREPTDGHENSENAG